MVMRALILSGLLVASGLQSMPPQNDKQKQSTVHVRGCLHGSTLELREDPGFDVPGGKLELQGSRDMRRLLKEHNGHHEEIVGVLKTRGRNHSVAVKEKRGEKTRVWVGASETRGTSTDDITAPPTLAVKDIVHLGPHCQ